MSRDVRRNTAAADPGIVMLTNAVMPDQLGGLQRYVRQLARALAAHGSPVTIVTKRVSHELPAQEQFPDGVRIRRYDIPERSNPLYAIGYPLASLRATGAVANVAGILHVHYPLQGFTPAVLGAPYVHTFHAPIYRELLPEHQDRYSLPEQLRGALVETARAGEARVAARSRETIVLTEYMRGELDLLSHAAAERAITVPAGLDSGFFAPGAGVVHEAAQGAGPLLFTARRLVPRTGVSELVRAMPAVLAKLPSARLAIAGDGPLRTEIRTLLRDLSLQDEVILLGRVSDIDLRDWYRAADLFVLPTQELEGFGMSTTEALACGTPAVGTPVGGTPEILRPIDERLVAGGITADDIATAILGIFTTEGLLASLARQVRDHVVPGMDWSTIADRHLEVYERMKAEGRRRPGPLLRRPL
jgi:glycosyltransferase involved in cell wall biosynthesis